MMPLFPAKVVLTVRKRRLLLVASALSLGMATLSPLPAQTRRRTPDPNYPNPNYPNPNYPNPNYPNPNYPDPNLPKNSPAQNRPDRNPKKKPTLERKGRDVLVIDDIWQSSPAPATRAEEQGWENMVSKEAKDTLVPSLNAPTESKIRAVWFWRRFDLPANWKGQTIRLRFEAVAERAEVWLNGQKLGEHEGGAVPFEYTVTAQAKVGESNLLAVRVAGGRWGTGLWQGVMLLAHDEAYMGDCVPQTDAGGHLNGALEIFNTSQITGDATLDAFITPVMDANKEPDNGNNKRPGKASTRVVAKTNQNLRLTPGRNITTLLLTVPKKQTTLWTPDTPSLYLLQLSFRQDKDILDTAQTTFGFREYGYQNGVIMLNGSPLTIKALPASANSLGLTVVATVEDQNRLRLLYRKLKDSGVNLVYLNAPPPTMLRIADEEGLLVIEGARTGQSPAATATELQALIVRDRAHPALLGWHLPDPDPATAATLRTLDPTRFLLVGTGTATKLWAPNETGPATGNLPVALMADR